jgi:hypothetical protein
MMHLDGNAAAGVLAEAFGTEMTTVVGTCASCGATGAIGQAHVYMGGPGTVVRCSHCEAILIALAWSTCWTVDATGITRFL